MKYLLSLLVICLFMVTACGDQKQTPPPVIAQPQAPAPAPATPPPTTTQPTQHVNNLQLPTCTFPKDIKPEEVTFEEFTKMIEKCGVVMPPSVTVPSSFNFETYIGNLAVQMPMYYDPWAFTGNFFMSMPYYPTNAGMTNYVNGLLYWYYLQQAWVLYAQMYQIQLYNYQLFLNQYLAFMQVPFYGQFSPYMQNYLGFQMQNPGMFANVNGYWGNNGLNFGLGFANEDMGLYLNFMQNNGATNLFGDNSDSWHFGMNLYIP